MASRAVALRLDMEAAIGAPGGSVDRAGRRPRRRAAKSRPAGAWGDVILARRRRRPAIISVVIDDALQGVTDVCAAKTCLSTSVHRLLQRLLDVPQPVDGITGSSARLAKNFQVDRRPACANCAPPAPRRQISANLSDCRSFSGTNATTLP
jgi:hypothetical protein